MDKRLFVIDQPQKRFKTDEFSTLDYTKAKLRGEVKSQGIEISLIANPIEGLNLVAGYSKNKSEVTKDYEENGYLGLRPEEAGPEQLINFWASYSFLTGDLKGFGFGLESCWTF